MTCLMCKKEVYSDVGYYKMGDVYVCPICAARYTLDAIALRAYTEDVTCVETVFGDVLESTDASTDDTAVDIVVTPEQEVEN